MQDIQALLHYSEGTCDLFLFLGEKEDMHYVKTGLEKIHSSNSALRYYF